MANKRWRFSVDDELKQQNCILECYSILFKKTPCTEFDMTVIPCFPFSHILQIEAPVHFAMKYTYCQGWVNCCIQFSLCYWPYTAPLFRLVSTFIFLKKNAFDSSLTGAKMIFFSENFLVALLCLKIGYNKSYYIKFFVFVTILARQ